jgi:CspA family cold shock protein
MAQGVVKWFHPTKGFGFISPSSGEKDVFVHITAVQKAGLRGLDAGQAVRFDITPRDGRPAAVNLECIR